MTTTMFTRIAKACRENGTTESETRYGIHTRYYYTETFWVTIVRANSHTHYIALYRPTGECVYDRVDWRG